MAVLGVVGVRATRADSLLRWLLAGLIVGTAVAKLSGFSAFRDALAASSGLYESIASLAAAAVIVCELITAACLLSREWRAIGGALAALLAVGFALWNYRLARSGSAGCGCLGSWIDAKPAEMLPLDAAILCAGLLTFWLNAAPAGRVTPPPPPRRQALRAWYPHLALGYCLFVALALQARTARQGRDGHGRDRAQAAEAVTGVVAPSFGLRTSDGGWFGTNEMTGRLTLLCFLSVDCETCIQIAPMLERARVEYGQHIQIAAVVPTGATAASCRGAAVEMARAGWYGLVACDPRAAVTALFSNDGIQWPSAVLVDASGTIRAVRRDAAFVVDGFLSRVAESSTGRGAAGSRSSVTSAPMPDAEITFLDGRRVRLSGLWRGRPLVVSFLKAGCGNCATRLAQIEAEFGSRADATVLHLFSSRRGAAAVAERARLLGSVAVCSPSLLRDLAVDPPVTLVVYQGRVWFRAGPFSVTALRTTLATLVAPLNAAPARRQ